VQLTVTGTTEKTTTVTRLNADGSSVPVRTSDGGPLVLSGATTLYDYEMGFGQAVSYSSLESPSTVSTQVAVTVPQVWLIHPGVPGLSMPISLRPGTLQDETFVVKQGVFYPMGRTNPVVITDGARRGSQSQLVVLLQSLDEAASLSALLSDASTLLLNIPPSMATGFDTSYIAISDMKRSRWDSVVIDPNRDAVLPFYVVDRPAGGSQAQRTYVDLLSFASYQSLQAAYPTYTALLAGP
jgi:hypothetical protein